MSISNQCYGPASIFCFLEPCRSEKQKNHSKKYDPAGNSGLQGHSSIRISEMLQCITDSISAKRFSWLGVVYV